MAYLKSIDDFKATLSTGGVRACMFQIIITPPTGNQFVSGIDTEQIRTLSMLAKGASIPPSNLSTCNIGLPAGGNMKLPGSRLYEPWATRIINDGGMQLRNFFERWSESVIGFEDWLSITDIERYMSTIEVIQLDRQSLPIRQYTLHKCYPVTLSPIELAYDQFDTITEFDVTWNYHYMEVNQSGLAGISAGVNGSIGIDVRAAGVGFNAGATFGANVTL